MTLKFKQEPYGDHQYSVELVDHHYSGIKFVIGKVALDEDNFTLKYNYDIIESNVEYDKKEFEHTIGDLIVQMLRAGVTNNDLVYTGGVDEN